MSSPDFATVAPRSSSTPMSEVEVLLLRLASRKHEWPRVEPKERARLLERCISHTLGIAEEWVEAACIAKGIDPKGPLAGEEWLGGPMATVRNMRLLAEAMRADGEPPLPRIWRRASDQFAVQVFPQHWTDRLLFAGITAEIWIEPGKPASQGAIYRDKRARVGEERPGKLALVLGAGNVASIGPMDALHKLFVEDETVLVKANPVNDYLKPFWEEAFRPLVNAGFFGVVRGGAELGSFLCHHREIDSIHMTGSDRTHDAIVWGNTATEQQKNKAAGTPKLRKPITSELGAVTPCLVVPGAWTERDLAFQARQVAGMVANNASFNCNATKALVTAKGWPERQRFLELVHEALESTPVRKAYYPGAQERYQRFLDAYPQAKPLAERTHDIVPWTMIPDVPPDGTEYALKNEAFCGVLADVALDESRPSSFLEAMAEFANEECWGTLSCTMLIDPKTAAGHARALERAIENLRYGGICVNAFAGLIYGLVTPSWGAYPGHPLEDVRSGRGTVHNALLLDHPQKTVVRAPFRMSPTPVSFADHRTVHELGRLLTAYEARPSLPQLPNIIRTALRG